MAKKKYNWPNSGMANGSGQATHGFKYIGLSIKTLGDIIQDAIQESPEVTDQEIWDKIREVSKNVDDEISDWAAFRQLQLFEWIKEKVNGR